MKPTYYIYDSHQQQKVPLEPIQPDCVKIYICGPTVYDYSHLGHARSAIAFDLLQRTLELSGYGVQIVKNFTDIDDKIIHKAHQEQTDIKTLSEHFIASYLEDMQALGVQRAHLEPRASQHLESIAMMIQTLLDKGCAYKTSNGDIYLDTTRDPRYGALSAHSLDQESLSRIEDNPHKRHEKDFALWKAYKGDSDVGYDSVVGKGRPGWHIECSAMIFANLAYLQQPYQIDIHGGGSDLFFPHHENEASQTRCAFDQELAKYWMHNGFVNISGQKMSKSLGNSFYIKDALKVYDGEILRNYLLGTHYRAILHFNEEDLLVHKKRLDKLYRLKKRALELAQPRADNAPSPFGFALLECMRDDLNISKALSVLEEHLRLLNENLDHAPKPTKKQKAQEILQDLAFVETLLGLGGKDPMLYFQLGVDGALKAHIEAQIQLRLQAKQAKNFALADRIREELATQGILLMDRVEGTIWEKLW
ncbi:cysteine--tRNA ligase [Helicobacter bizzozeronii]|uniref:cysteine--tRNA ligase n=1 Tax=Helicobacter bizzozeronii TaxID=56877 RepID=UPI000CEEBC12|nr:cysteine--tRNA ligase [Helicobacter bizzozeronii]